MESEEKVLTWAGVLQSMGFLDALRKREDGEDESNWFHECRNCGTSVESKTTVCPACGAAEIACYQL